MTNKTIEQDVVTFIRQYVCDDPMSWQYAYIDQDYSLSTGKLVIEEDTAFDIIEQFAKQFYVDMKKFNFEQYWPNTGIPFLPNFLLPHYLRTSRHDPKPLTVKMLVESAKAGRWLYD